MRLLLAVLLTLMAINVNYRDGLDQQTVTELDNTTAHITGFLRQEHNADGSHADVTANSLSLGGAPVGEWVDIPYAAARYTTVDAAVWTVQEADVQYLKVARVGSIAFVCFRVVNTAITVDTATNGLYIFLQQLNTFPRSTNFSDPTLSPPFGIGMIEWSRNNGGSGMQGLAYIDAYSSRFVLGSGGAGVTLELTYINPSTGKPASWPIDTYDYIHGQIWFPLTPNNQPFL